LNPRDKLKLIKVVLLHAMKARGNRRGALLADIKRTQMMLDKDTHYHQLVCVCVCVVCGGGVGGGVCVCVCVCLCEQSGCTTGATVCGGSLEAEV